MPGKIKILGIPVFGHLYHGQNSIKVFDVCPSRNWWGGCNSETMVPLMEHLQALGCGCASDNQLTIVISGAVGGVARP